MVLIGKIFLPSPRPDLLFEGMNYFMGHSPNSTAGSLLPTALRKPVILWRFSEWRHPHIYFHNIKAEAFSTTPETQPPSDPQMLPRVRVNSKLGFVNIWIPSYLTQKRLFQRVYLGCHSLLKRLLAPGSPWYSSHRFGIRTVRTCCSQPDD